MPHHHADPPAGAGPTVVTSARRRAGPGGAGTPGVTPGRRNAGQAAVELVALLPLLAAVLALAWQVVLAAHTVWAAGVAARAAARAHAVGADAAAAARAHLPRSLEHGLKVAARPDGGVSVSLPIPGVVPRLDLGRAGATARFDPQRG